jgi:DNA-binding NarL/FixJ family response regulator
MATIIIADQTPVLRRGLREVVQSNPLHQVVGETDDGLKVLSQIEKFKPSVLMMNPRLATLNGLELMRRVQQLHSETKIIVVSQSFNLVDLAEAFQWGAHGFINLNSSLEEMAKALNEVIAGKRHLAPAGIQNHLPSLPHPGGKGKTFDAVYETLTPREREILQLAAEGIARKDIAKRLSISVRTVETHRIHILHKLGLRSQTDLVRYAIRQGLITA